MWFSQHRACPYTASQSSWKQTLRGSTPTSHHIPRLVFGKLVCKWGPGTADISWRGNFGGMTLGETGMQCGRDAWWLGATCGLCSRALCRDTQRSTNPVLGLAWYWSLPAMGFSCQRLVTAGSICYLPTAMANTTPHREPGASLGCH